MNDAPRRTLRELIAKHGPGLCSDARRCEGLLRDLCGAHRREVNILVGALRERVPLDLLAGRNALPPVLLLTRLAKRLEDHLAQTEEASRWAVDSWALALGVVSEAELREMEGRREKAAAPRVEAAPRPAPRPPIEGEAPARRPPADQNARPPAAPPQARPGPPTTPQARPPAAPTRTRPPTAPSPATRPPTPGGATVPARQRPAPPAPHTTSPPPPARTGGPQTPPVDARARGRRGRWRGCLVGCFLLMLLAAALFVGAPLVLNLLREEQQQRSLEPPPVQTR